MKCELWTGHVGTHGYGLIFRGGKTILAHRDAYEKAKGPIPDGLVVRHTCDVRLCVNPEHLLIGTHADNMRDMLDRHRENPWARDIQYCKHGHEFTEENTYRSPSRPNERMCKACMRTRARERYRKLHPEAPHRKPY